MNRRKVLLLSAGPILASILWRLKMSNTNETITKAPALFIGHGSPMHAIEENDFTKFLNKIGELYPNPKAILCISAHWLTKGTFLTESAKPKIIYDFYGFPEALYQVKYPAPGLPKLAKEIQQKITTPQIGLDQGQWGLDHGSWTILKHMYPKANVPVIQLSIDIEKPAEFHLALGKELHALREQGVLILGSGNIVHNLGRLNFNDPKPFDWAVEFDQWVKEMLLQKNYSALTNEYLKSNAGKLSIPTPDHYYPLLYTLGASNETDKLYFDYEGIDLGSISMRCLSFRST